MSVETTKAPAVDVGEILRMLEKGQRLASTAVPNIPINRRFLYEPDLTPQRRSGWGS